MNKSIHFTGQPTFAQLMRLVPRDLIARHVLECKSDRYYKKFTTWHHLNAMLFACYGHCQSLREVVSGMRALEGRVQSCDIRYFPTRSTFSEANRKRSETVFERIYQSLKQHWVDRLLPDSRLKRNLYLIDSTTIKLFQEIFKGAGKSQSDGRRKGGLKVHMAVRTDLPMPSVIHITQAAYNDVGFAKQLSLPAGSTVIMDRGYRDYKMFNDWTQAGIRWVTRMHPRTYFKKCQSNPVSDRQKRLGVQRDEHLQLGYPVNRIPKVLVRRICFIDADSKKKLQFMTNDFNSSPAFIAQLYKKRWGIELLFKRLKQNMPLQYFLGDNQNAVKIQIWCALIADLLLQIIQRQVKRKWAFSNIVSLVRLHLFNYLNLFTFLENPETAAVQSRPPDLQLRLALSG